MSLPNKVELRVGELVKLDLGVKINPLDWDTSKLEPNQRQHFRGGTFNDFVNVPMRTMGSTALYTYTREDTTDRMSEYNFARNSRATNVFAADGIQVVAGGSVELTLPSQGSSTLFKKDTVTSTTTLQVRANDEAVRKLENDLVDGKYVTVIPDGWVFKSATYRYRSRGEKIVHEDGNVTYQDGPVVTREVTRPIVDYLGTGLRAIEIETETLIDRQTFSDLSIELVLEANDTTPKGDAYVKTYVIHSNNKRFEVEAVHGQRKEADVLDLDNDGDVNEQIPAVSRRISYTPPKELVAVKKAGRTVDSLATETSESFDAGDVFLYGFELTNLNDNHAVKSFEMMDYVPQQGNYSMRENQEEVYTHFNSDVTTPYHGPVRLVLEENGQKTLVDPTQHGFEVLYSTDPVAQQNFAQNYKANFNLSEAEVSDFSKVTMFKVRMKAGKELAPLQKFLFVVEAKVPDDLILTRDDERTLSSFAMAGSNAEGVQFDEDTLLEVVTVEVPYINYKFSGTIFADFSLNGQFNTGEQLVSGMTVQLFRVLQDGNEELVREAQTDADGAYLFELPHRGQYRLRTTLPTEATNSKIHSGTYEYYDSNQSYEDYFPVVSKRGELARVDGRRVSHGVNLAGESAEMRLDPRFRHRIVNVGLVEKPIEFPVRKVWVKPKRADIDEVTLNLVADGQKKAIQVDSASNYEGRFTQVRRSDQGGQPYRYTVTEEPIEGYAYRSDLEDGVFVVRNIVDERIAFDVTKRWIGEATSEVTIVVKEGDVEVDRVILSPDNAYRHRFELLKYNPKTYPELSQYTIEEIAPKKYSKRIEGNQTDGFVVTNTNNETLAIRVSKRFIGAEAQSVTVKLKRDGQVTQTLRLSEQTQWKGVFENLRRFDESDGHEYRYDVEEEAVEGYSSQITGDSLKGYQIVNRNDQTVQFQIQKVWSGEIAAKQVTALVKANGQEVARYLLNAANQWSVTSEAFRKFDENTGEEQTYTVEELESFDHYIKRVDGNETQGFVLRNISDEVVEIRIRKKWLGAGADLATVYLKADGERIETATLTAENQFEVLYQKPKYHPETGALIRYTVEEQAMPGYQSQVREDKPYQFVVENLNVETISVTVTKRWIGPAAESVELALIRNDLVIAEVVTLNEEKGWMHTFTQLRKYDDRGNLYRYSIQERQLDHYSVRYGGNLEAGFEVINRNDEQMDLHISKKWIGPASESVEFILYLGEGEEKTELDRRTVTEADQWQTEFTGLRKYDEKTGAKLVYTVEETAIQNYSSEVRETNTGFEFTNRNDSVFDLRVDKRWIGPEAESVEVILYKGEGEQKTELARQQLSADDNWFHIFEGLRLYDEENGERLVYSIEETPIEGYHSEVRAGAKGIEVINRNDEVESLKVKKTWVGPEQESIELILYKGEGEQKEELRRLSLDASTGWEGEFDQLRKYDERSGERLYYSVEEVVPDLYSAKQEWVDGVLVLTNTNDELLPIKVKKIWKGEPLDEIRVRLYLQDGDEKVLIEELLLTKEGDYEGQFAPVRKYDTETGEAKRYIVEEDALEDYVGQLEGDAETGFVFINIQKAKPTPSPSPSPTLTPTPTEKPVTAVPISGERANGQLGLWLILLGLSQLLFLKKWMKKATTTESV